MIRRSTTFLSLLLAIGVVWPGLLCACSVDSAQASERPTFVESSPSENTESNKDCCSDEGDRSETDAGDDCCCDHDDCTGVCSSETDEPVDTAAVFERSPVAEFLQMRPDPRDIPAAWTLDILDRVEPDTTLPDPSGPSPHLFAQSPRYLTLQVLRL